MINRNGKKQKTLSIVASLFFIVLMPAAVPAYGLEQKSRSSLADPEEIEKTIFELVNKERKTIGVPLLSFSKELKSIALRHSRDMALQGDISHISSKGKSYTDRLIENDVFFTQVGGVPGTIGVHATADPHWLVGV